MTIADIDFAPINESEPPPWPQRRRTSRLLSSRSNAGPSERGRSLLRHDGERSERA
jgi:hypothetical protein